MPHPLVEQLYFTRHEWRRGLDNLTEEDVAAHLGPMNSIGWTVGHLAWHEQRNWLVLAQDTALHPELAEFAPGSPMSTPAAAFVWPRWEAVTAASNAYLDSLTADSLLEVLQQRGDWVQTVGSAMHRLIYHYWFHIGEIQAMRQMLGHEGLESYVGPVEKLAPFRQA